MLEVLNLHSGLFYGFIVLRYDEHLPRWHARSDL